MPKLNFAGVDDVDDYSPIPDGSYLCRLAEIESDTTRNGDEMWKLRFAVESGPQAGRYIFDNMVFSAAAMKRVKLICSRLGMDTGGELDLTTESIRGRRCVVTVQTEEYVDDQDQTKRRNVVPFAGYDFESAVGTVEDADNDEDDLPF
jgi:Protein of unknown function (DUF669)